MSNPLAKYITIIAAWQVACAVAMAICGYAIGRLVHSVGTGLFGDEQESYLVYARVSTYVVIFTVIALATGVGVTLLTLLERHSSSFRQILATFVVWHAACFAVLVASEEFGLYWMFHLLDRVLFGLPENLFSFRNVMLPRAIAWVVSSTMAIAAVLSLRGKLVLAQSARQEKPRFDVRHASDRKHVAAEQNPYAAPQASSTHIRIPGQGAGLRIRLALMVSLLAIIANAFSLPMVGLVGFTGIKADTSPREHALWGALALAFGAAIITNLIALINRRRLTRRVAGSVVAINGLMAVSPHYWLTSPIAAWGELFVIWSFTALTVAALAITPKNSSAHAT